MNFGTLSHTWAALGKSAKIMIVTEPERYALAEKITNDNRACVAEITIVDLTQSSSYQEDMQHLTEHDLLLVLLTVDGFMKRGYRDLFPPFCPPEGVKSKYIFIRLDIPEQALLTGLNTEREKIQTIIAQCRAYTPGSLVHVTTEKGTDITVQIAAQELIAYDARPLGGHAFLPAAEISEELVPGSANGIIVADITVGELRFGAELIDALGLVDTEVKITVQQGKVVDITGGDIARRLKKGLNQLDKQLQVMVELGHGLSDSAPTGIIGVDESMNGTCHFGIGDRNPYHVDVVLGAPQITVIKG